MQAQKADDVLERYRRSPEYKALVEADEARIDGQRAAASKTIATAHADRSKRRPALVAKSERAGARVLALERELAAARAEALDAWRAVQALDSQARRI